MKTIKYVEKENGTRYVAAEGKEMEVIEEISKLDFEEKFPEVSTDVDGADAFLENGKILLESEWNGERYFSDGKEIKKLYKDIPDYGVEVVGYYEV